MNGAPGSEPYRWRRGLWALALVLCAATAGAQNKADLQRERDAIQAKIATTEKLLNQTASNKQDALVQLRLVNERMRLREQLIRNHQSDIRAIERSMNNADSEIRSLEGHIAALKDEYARMIQAAYKHALGQNPWMYVFAAEDFTQAVIRFQMLQSYSTLRKEQVEQIQQSQLELAENRKSLEDKRAELEAALADVRQERNRLDSDRAQRQALVESLKGEESRLRAEVQKAQAEKQRLNDAIRRIIEAELKAERESTAGEFALTPEGKIVSAAFERNRATLPWPVVRGVLTGKFGRQNHPTLPGITIDNNGIDISTEAGSSVLAVFGGTVSSTFEIPGAGWTVILSHGAFRTVYSNLESASIQKGMPVEAGEKIGRVRTNNGQSILHFEVWRVQGNNQTPQDPAQWLVRH
jgi:septal ring factor EnvC (AmiA/AmiB activator)